MDTLGIENLLLGLSLRVSFVATLEIYSGAPSHRRASRKRPAIRVWG
jgi:hypothetical protein